MEAQKSTQLFIQGGISAEFIARCIAKYQNQTQIGAHDIFLGQVRADIIDDKIVAAIDYSAYEAMAAKKFEEIRELALETYELKSVDIYHSLGEVKAGEICLFVMVSSAHRKTAFEGIRYVVEEIKAQVPVFGKELFEDDSYQWKVNT